MRELLCEKDSFGLTPSTKDLARHIYTRMSCGKIVIVAENPVVFLSALRKQWIKFTHKVQRERSSTLDSILILELAKNINRMQSMRFTAKWPANDYPADVSIATIERLLQWPPEANCRTLYITCAVTSEQLHLITAWMAKRSLVVTCVLAAS